jgi:hypothetical protein
VIRLLIALALFNPSVPEQSPPISKPSGFWVKTKVPAKGEPYHWQHMAIGGAIVGVMVLVTIAIVRRARVAGAGAAPTSSSDSSTERS